MHWVYILYSERLDRYYIGETIDLNNRLNEHNTGFYKNSFTSKTNDWTLFVNIACDDVFQAKKIEKHIKKMKSKTYIKNLNFYPEIISRLKNNN